MRKLLFTLTFLAAFVGSTFAQDKFRFSAHYLDSRIPLVERDANEQTVNGFSASADVRLFKLGKLRGSAAYEFQQLYNVEVYPSYFDGTGFIDLYRNVKTHYVGAQLGYTLGYAVEPFIGYFVGTNKVHEDAERQTVSKVRIGVNIPFSKESHFFVKAAIDFNRSYGSATKPMNPMDPLPPIAGSFATPDTRQVVVGAGYRFGR
jgi:predicted porin